MYDGKKYFSNYQNFIKSIIGNNAVKLELMFQLLNMKTTCYYK